MKIGTRMYVRKITETNLVRSCIGQLIHVVDLSQLVHSLKLTAAMRRMERVVLFISVTVIPFFRWWWRIKHYVGCIKPRCDQIWHSDLLQAGKALSAVWNSWLPVMIVRTMVSFLSRLLFKRKCGQASSELLLECTSFLLHGTSFHTGLREKWSSCVCWHAIIFGWERMHLAVRLWRSTLDRKWGIY